MPAIDNREIRFQQKLLDRYAVPFGLAADLGTRLVTGEVSEAEIIQVTTVSDRLVMRFMDDMRGRAFEAYSDQDLDLVLTMIDANHKPVEPEFDPKTGQSAMGSISKIIPNSTVSFLLNPQTPPDKQTLGGFLAPSKNSDGLSPQQCTGQFGLDYANSPFLSKQGSKVIPSPYLFALEAPATPALADCMKIPIDPRLYAKLLVRAQQNPDAAAIVGKYQHELALVAQGKSDQERLQQQYPDLKIVRAEDPPYTGTSASMYGSTLAGSNPYAAIMQEHIMIPPPGIPEGTKLTLKLPLDDPDHDPDRGDAPAGVKTVEVAEFRDGRWWKLKNPDEVEMEFKVAMLTGLFKYDTSGFEQDFASLKESFPTDSYFPKPPREAIRKVGRDVAQRVPGTARSGTGRDLPRSQVKDRRKTYRKKKPA